ncbi:hypothetical protein ACEQ8H_008879 [Pleosporales sp. CAS-2024a]
MADLSAADRYGLRVLMKLYTFGSPLPFQSYLSQHRSNNVAPACILQAQTIRVLWLSWCDLIVAYKRGGQDWTIEYRGHSLTRQQAAHITTCGAIRRASQLENSPAASIFFGERMGAGGVRGYLDCSNNEMTVFSSALEMDHGQAAVQKYAIPACLRIASICMTSAGAYVVVMSSRTNDDDDDDDDEDKNTNENENEDEEKSRVHVFPDLTSLTCYFNYYYHQYQYYLDPNDNDNDNHTPPPLHPNLPLPHHNNPNPPLPLGPNPHLHPGPPLPRLSRPCPKPLHARPPIPPHSVFVHDAD